MFEFNNIANFHIQRNTVPMKKKKKSFHEYHREQYALFRNILFMYFCHLHFHPYLEFTPPTSVCFHHCKETTPCTSLSLLSIFSFFHPSKLASPRGDFTWQTSVNFSSGGESTTSGESDALRKVSNRSRAGSRATRGERQRDDGDRLARWCTYAARRGFHKAEAFTDGKLARRPRWPGTVTLALPTVGHKNSCSL